eukprot:5054154-Amphidinium_carterae.1
MANRQEEERAASWKTYVQDMWERSPKTIYKRIQGSAFVWDLWDLAILHDNGYALSPDQTAHAE